MRIAYIGIGSETLLDDFSKAGVEFEKIQRQPGIIMNAGDAVEIVTGLLPKAFAAMTNWVKARPSRRIQISFKNHQIATFDAQNYNVEEVLKVLEEVRNINALETKKPDELPPKAKHPAS